MNRRTLTLCGWALAVAFIAILIAVAVGRWARRKPESIAPSFARNDTVTRSAVGADVTSKDSANAHAQPTLRPEPRKWRMEENPLDSRAAMQSSPVTLEPVTAMVSAGGQQYAVTPNQVGTLVPRVRIEPRQTISVMIPYPEAELGAKVVAAIEDGGQLEDGQRVLSLLVDSEHRVKFQFTAGADRGIYRVALRQGTDLKYLELWAGEELATVQR